jgi:nucleotide-binding universal stress UspA family protein
MFRNILVAVDRSQNGERVLDAAIALATAMRSNLMLLHVLSNEEEGYPKIPTLATLEYFPMDSQLFDDYQRNLQVYQKQGLELLQSYTDKATVAGVNTEFTQNFGNPGRTICKMAQTWGADLIILGRRGHSGLKELVLGSVSNYVLHHAPCSIFTVQSQIKNNPGISQERQSVMAP